jgi:hypothetical protein
MTAYLSGVTRAPVTSFIISMEMTNNHQMLLPLMAASVVASRISKFISPTPLYHKMSENFTEEPFNTSEYVKKNGEEYMRRFVPDGIDENEKYSSKIKNETDKEAGRSRNQ